MAAFGSIRNIMVKATMILNDLRLKVSESLYYIAHEKQELLSFNVRLKYVYAI